MSHACRYCDKLFAKKYNRDRHESQSHNNMTSEDEETMSQISENDEAGTDEGDARSGFSKDIFGAYKPDSEIDSEHDDELDQRDENPWKRVVTSAWDDISPSYEKAKQAYLDKGDDPDTASDKAYGDSKVKLLNKMTNIFLDGLAWARRMYKDATYRKLKKSVRVVQKMEEFDDQEAMEYALCKRRFLLERLLRYFKLPWETGEDSDNETEDEATIDWAERGFIWFHEY